MTAAEFAQLLNACRVGRGRWSALCPAHGDRKRSLSIADGKRQPILLRCMSQGCTPADILKAMGLTWADILGPRAITPEIRQKLKDQEQLRRLEGRWMAASMNRVWDRRNPHYWAKVAANLDAKICALKLRMDPPTPEEKIYTTIERYGWDRIWTRFLEMDRGIAVSNQWSPPSPRQPSSIESEPWTIPSALPMPKEAEYVSW